MLSHPLEIEIWRKQFEKRLPGDHVTHVLLAMIGCMLEALVSKGEVDRERWFFFERTLADSDEEPTLEEHRAAIRFITRGK